MAEAQAIPALLGRVNIEREQAVLGAIMSDIEVAIDILPLLTKESFFDPVHQAIFTGLNRVVTETVEPLDAQIITIEAKRAAIADNQDVVISRDYVSSLPKSAKDIAVNVDLLNHDKNARALIKLARYIFEQADLTIDSAELHAKVSEQLQSIGVKQDDKKIIQGGKTNDVMQIVSEKILMAQQEHVRIPRWPWEFWNRLIRPPTPGKFIILAAPDGVGKSSYAQMIAECWAKQGFKAAYVNSEDPIEELKLKRTVRHSCVPLAKIEDGTTSEEERQRIQAAEDHIDEWRDNLAYLAGWDMTMPEVLYGLEKQKRDNGLELVCIDWLGSFNQTRGQYKLQDWQVYTEDAQRLIGFSNRWNLGLVVICQGTKEMLDAEVPTRKMIYGGAQVYQRAKTVVMFRRKIVDQAFNIGGKLIAGVGELSPTVNIFVDKQNKGGLSRFDQFFRGEYFQIDDKPWWGGL